MKLSRLIRRPAPGVRAHVPLVPGVHNDVARVFEVRTHIPRDGARRCALEVSQWARDNRSPVRGMDISTNPAKVKP